MITDFETLQAAASHWQAMADFREARERCKRYCYGRQWDDLIHVDGRMMREEDYIRQQGNIPLKNNLIRRMVRSVLGVFRNQYAFPSAERLNLDDESPAQAAFYRHLIDNALYNRMEELHARTMEEFLISGLAVHRKSTAGNTMRRRPGDRHAGRLRTDYVAPDTFFVDAATRDFRGWDVRMIGQTHDLDFLSLCAAMARTEEECAALRDIYLPQSGTVAGAGGSRGFGTSRETLHADFLSPSAPGLCRVIEVWTRETCERYRVHDRTRGTVYKIEADRRADLPAGCEPQWMLDEEWHYRYIAPTGHVLAQGISPLPGGGHPYVWKAYPFIDGEIHSFVADVIDQQRHANRLIKIGRAHV